MDRGWYLRFSLFVVAIVAGWLALWPSLDALELVPPAPKIVRDTFSGRISPGLDIKGGLRLMYEVDTDRYVETQRDRDATRLLRLLGQELGVFDEDQADAPSDEKLAELKQRVTVQMAGQRTILVTFAAEKDVESLSRKFLRENFPNLGKQSTRGGEVKLVMPEERIAEMREKAVEQAVRTISNRIDNLGLREATVMGRDNDLIVEVPGAEEAQFERIRGIISKTAQLEFRGVDDLSPYVNTLTDLPAGIERDSEVVSAGPGNPQASSPFLVAKGADAQKKLAEYVATLTPPEDRRLVLGRHELDPDDPAKEAYRTYLLVATSDVTGRHVEDAAVTFDPNEGNRPVVSLQFKREGAELFRQLSVAYLKKRMAIVLDDRVESAPVIQSEIGGGRAQITLGSYLDYSALMREANDLVIVLKAGALDAPLSPSNEQLIGPTLGRDSVRKGAQGAVVGVLLVLVFMAVYYSVAGLVADVMVVLNLLFLLALLAALEATLTLPGIAAVALTVGMAVDANVLITERIREELRIGKSPRSAVDQGFKRALSSVLDSQLTTFIAGVVLYQYGTGPIKGFAVMLMIGIVTSLFTGIFCSRVVFDWIVRGLKVQNLKVG